MRTVQRAALPMLLFLTSLGLVGLANGCTSGSADDEDVSTARDGLRRVDELVDAGNLQQAAVVLAEIHEPMHATAARLASIDGELTEVVTDITEVLHGQFSEPTTEHSTLSELSHKAIEIFDEARYVLG